MSDQTEKITSEQQEPTFFAMIPQMALDDLDPYELALYCRYRQIAREHGACFMSNKELAKQTHMSLSKMKLARASLEERKYIRIERHFDEATGVENAPPTVTLRDLWAINHQRYAISSETGEPTVKTEGGVTKKQGGGHVVTTPSHHMTGGGHVVTPNNMSLIREKEKDFDDASAPSPQPQPVSKPTATGGTPKAPKPRKPNPWYDAINTTWGFTGARNGGMEKMLRGVSSSKQYKAYNLEIPLTTPDQLADWKRWYLGVKYRGKPDTILPSSPEKVQSSIGEWQAIEQARTERQQQPAPRYVPRVVEFTADELRAGEQYQAQELARLGIVRKQAVAQ